nr:dihydrofolate reductase [Escherichia coli]
MGSCAAPSAKGDDKFITTDYLQQCQANYRATGCVVVSTLSHAIALASELGNELYVAGGAEIYTLALPHAHGVFLSEVHQTFEGDAFFPMLNETEFELVSTETIQAVIPYTHSVYARRNG